MNTAANQDSNYDAPENLEMVMDIPVELSVELGRTKLLIRDFLQLSQGSVVELDKLAGESLDMYANGRLVARGVVVSVREKYGIRLTEIVSRTERIEKLGK